MKTINRILINLVLGICLLLGVWGYGQPTASSVESDKLDQVVGEFTGTASVSMPLGSVSNGSLSVGLSLSYSSTGFRPQELASSVGLGWLMSSGYMITRQVNGKADGMASNYQTSCCSTYDEYASLSHDGEYDLFRLNLPGYSGEFVRRRDGNGTFWGYATLQTSEIKIIYNVGEDAFYVTTTDGVTVRFIAGSWNADYNSGNYNIKEIASWVPDIVVSYDKKDTIQFSYMGTDINYRYTTINSEIVAQKIKRLYRVSGINDQLQVNWGVRNDVDGNAYSFQNKVESVEYSSGSSCYRYFLNIDHIENGYQNGTQISLNNIQKKSCDNTLVEPTTNFDYFGTNNLGQFSAPNKWYTGIDHWGYYNGSNTNDPNNLLPSPNGSANRNPNLSNTKNLVLKSVRTPSGKITTYDYELNTYKVNSSQPIVIGPAATCPGFDPTSCLNFHSATLTPFTISNQDMLNGSLYVELAAAPGYYGVVTVNISSSNGMFGSLSFNLFGTTDGVIFEIDEILDQYGANLFQISQTYYITVESTNGIASVSYNYYNTNIINTGGGLRVSSIVTSDYNNVLPSDTTTYAYEHGVLMSSLNNSVNFQRKYYNVIGDANALNFISGVNIGYKYVTVKKTGLGKTVKLFNVDNTKQYSGGWRIITDFGKSGFGNLLSTSVYDSTGTLLTKDSTEYSTNSPKDIFTLNWVNKRVFKACSGGTCNQNVAQLYSYSNYCIRPTRNLSYYLGQLINTTTFEYSHPHTLQPKYITKTSGNGYETTTYLDYTNNIWTSTDIKNKFVTDNFIQPYTTSIYENGIFSGGGRTDFAFYNATGQFVGITNGGNTSYVIKPSTQYLRRKDYSNSAGIEYADHYYHEYTPNFELKIDQKANWPTKSYVYNRKRLIESNYNGFITSTQYYGNSNLVYRTVNVDGTTQTYSYDPLFRLSSSVDDAANVTTNYAYNFIERSLTTTKIHTPVSGSLVSTVVNKTYGDVYGRIIAKVAVASSPTNKDVISAVEYDRFSRKIKDFLPFETSNSDGTLVSTPPATKFSLTKYEASPLSRVVETIAPDWYATKYEYGLNSSTDNVTGYASSKLTKETIIDGNGNRSISFKDFNGRNICTRQTNSTDLANQRKDTYTEYDQWSRPKKIVPPGASTTGTPELIYEYVYDVYDQVSEKKIPGKGLQKFWYNTRYQLCATQDANMGSNQWISYTYDDFGRSLKSGFSSSLFYSSPTFTTILTDNTYGTSSFLKDKIVSKQVNILGTSTNLTTTFSFDTRGRLFQSSFNNHKNASINKSVTLSYDNADNVLSSTYSFTSMPDGNHNMIEASTYDHRGRLINENFTHNGVFKTLATNVYNFRNELIQLRQGMHNSNTYLQDIDYTYRSNGMLEAINGPMVLNATGGDLFYEGLYFDNPLSGTGAAIQKNGNISNVRWQRRGALVSTNAYSYDNYNQLLSSDYSTYSPTYVLQTTPKYDETFTYDLRGNINTLTRYGDSTIIIDQLSYVYIANSNRAARVTDNSGITIGHNQNNQSTSGNVYTYDANGNLTSDLYRGISSISYNHLDLPTIIQRINNGGKLEMTYDATGNLLCRKTFGPNNVLLETRDFLGNFEYTNNVLDYIHTSQGD